ncbi:alpha/beta fold hydrolase [Streptomyces sp. ADMS]|uniref:alpha/beta fold hydrolase n=1 Tax=Streptomyces sp. ADMS TaxID=3071415 RepID=UPI00296F937B|nr:alpha/beta fold hydrolase [Streptomyces sp. ADMS]MDW4909325.1 alpha/beta fold hydrolase [Streptomyces sp. ADMS]
MIETKRPPQNVRREIITLSVDGIDLALHLWRPRGETKGAVFYFHGLQSHAGWLWEVGPQFADNDIAFFVLDRRGSGISGGERQDVPDVGTIVADYVAAIAHTRELIGKDVPLTLFGHCLGGSFLAALLHHPDFAVRYEATVFCSTWLGRLHAVLGGEERAALAAETSAEPWDAGLKPADFTDDPRYQEFMDNDDLAARTLTRRSRAVLLALEQLYLDPARPQLPDVPAAFVSGLTDPIVDLDATRGVFQELFSDGGLVVQFPTDRHYLFYTDVSRSLVDWTSTHTLLQGLDRGV